MIENLTNGRKYIGRKYAHVMQKNKIAGESDWRKYWGSCPALLADIKQLGKENFTKTIIGAYPTRGETNMREVEIQFKRDVLTARLPNGEREYYNGNILSRYFARTVESYDNPEIRAKMSLAIRNALISARPKKRKVK